MEKFIYQMPKVELHIHLEGAIPIEALWQLIKKYGADKELGSVSELEKKFRFKDFSEFIRTWSWKNQFLKEREDFVYVAREFAKQQLEQNILYTEVTFSPSDFSQTGLSIAEIAEALFEGLSEGAPSDSFSLICDLVRDYGSEKALETVEELKELKAFGVAGITIGGNEVGNPAENYAAAYERAKELGLCSSVHAGETVGAESIWSSLRVLKPDRLGHATTAISDPALMEYLKNKKVAIEACPISNVQTAVVKSLEEHPVNEFLHKGLHISINSDDPLMFGNPLSHELVCLVETFDWNKRQLVELQHAAIEMAFCSGAKKGQLVTDLNQFAQKMGAY